MSLHNRNAHERFTSHESTFMRNFNETKRKPNSRGRPSANPRVRNAHGHVTRTFLSEKLHIKCRRPRASQTRTARFQRPSAAEMHIDMSQEEFRAILRETSQEKGREPKLSTSIKHRPQLLPYEPLTVDTLLGKNGNPPNYSEHEQPIRGPNWPSLLTMLLRWRIFSER